MVGQFSADPPVSSKQNPAANPLQSTLNSRFHGPLMSFFMRRTRNDHALAQDLTQETLLRVIAAQQNGHVERADSYVFTVAANLLRDRKRLQARANPFFVPIDEATAGELEQQLVEGLSPERVLMSKDSLEDVLRALDELGEKTRDIFILFRLERMKQKEIAALLGIGQSTVEKHVMRATVHLAARYGGQKET